MSVSPEKILPLREYETVSLSELVETYEFSSEEKDAILQTSTRFPLKITRHYAQLLANTTTGDPIRKIIIPSHEELARFDDDNALNCHADESQFQPVEGIVHRYPGKLLFFPTLACFAHCRFCYRSERKVEPLLSKAQLQSAFEYIRKNKEIRDVIVTGGDPFTLSVDHLDYILTEIRKCAHVEIIRIGSRVLAYAPQVITDEMLRMLAKHKPIFIKSSFMHPDEITSATEEKAAMLSDAGIVLLQQGPMLKGINNSKEVLIALYEKLARNRIIPYYLGYGMVSPGTRHFTVYKDEATRIIKQMENNTSGFCVPILLTLDPDNNKVRTRS